jgi:glycosyltransferase involved in cell wall biosynthesis
MTRLLMTADAVGGVWTYALDLASAWRRLGVEVHLATMGPRPDRAQQEAAAVAGVRLWGSDYALEWAEEPWPQVAEAGEWLVDLSDTVRPDFVHLNGYVHAALPWPVPTVVVAHSCVLSWFWAVRGKPAPDSRSTYAAAVRKGLEAADAVVAPTAAMARELSRWYGFDRARVIPNGRDDSWVRSAPKTALVLGAGRVWDEAKNLAALERVACRLGWPVAIAGERREPTVTAPHGGGVHFLGRLPFQELSSWLLRAGLYVAPARYEPFGLGILEAAQAGCALVLGEIPSLLELWEGAALFVDPGDDEALAAACAELIADPARRQELARAARRRAPEFSLLAAARRYLELYQSLPARDLVERPA